MPCRSIRRESARKASRPSSSNCGSKRRCWSFPRGERTPDGQMLPLRPGVHLLIRRAESLILPVGIAGAYEALSAFAASCRFRPRCSCRPARHAGRVHRQTDAVQLICGHAARAGSAKAVRRNPDTCNNKPRHCGGNEPVTILLLDIPGLNLAYLGCYGNDWVATPNLDRLAGGARAVRSPLCRLPWRSRLRPLWFPRLTRSMPPPVLAATGSWATNALRFSPDRCRRGRTVG